MRHLQMKRLIKEYFEYDKKDDEARENIKSIWKNLDSDDFDSESELKAFLANHYNITDGAERTEDEEVITDISPMAMSESDMQGYDDEPESLLSEGTDFSDLSGAFALQEDVTDVLDSELGTQTAEVNIASVNPDLMSVEEAEEALGWEYDPGRGYSVNIPSDEESEVYRYEEPDEEEEDEIEVVEYEDVVENNDDDGDPTGGGEDDPP